jgi:VTC domain
MSITATIDALRHDFKTISLEQLNAKAAMLERLDNKYIVNAEVFAEFLMQTQDHFDMLEVGGIRKFRYDTLYFDTPNFDCFRDHQRGCRKRFKIRIRNYCDTHQSYLEIKLKDKRGSTTKKRMKCKDQSVLNLDEEQKCFVGYCYRDLYGEALPMHFQAALSMTYRRMTLVARTVGERMTIDNGIIFDASGTTRVVPPDQFVIETKSRNGNGLADQVLRRLHQHPSNRCSKYCVGLALTNPGLGCNTFKPTIRKLAKIS